MVSIVRLSRLHSVLNCLSTSSNFVRLPLNRPFTDSIYGRGVRRRTGGRRRRRMVL